MREKKFNWQAVLFDQPEVNTCAYCIIYVCVCVYLGKYLLSIARRGGGYSSAAKR